MSSRYLLSESGTSNAAIARSVAGNTPIITPGSSIACFGTGFELSVGCCLQVVAESAAVVAFAVTISPFLFALFGFFIEL